MSHKDRGEIKTCTVSCGESLSPPGLTSQTRWVKVLGLQRNDTTPVGPELKWARSDLSFSHTFIYIWYEYISSYILRKRLFKAEIMATCSDACRAPRRSHEPPAGRWLRGTGCRQALPQFVTQDSILEAQLLRDGASLCVNV